MSTHLGPQRDVAGKFEPGDLGPSIVQTERARAREKPKAIFLTSEKTFDSVFGPEELKDFAALLDIDLVPYAAEKIRDHPELLANTEIIVGSWGMPMMDKSFLSACPQLRAVFYAAGSVRTFTSAEFWKRKIIVTSAYAANAQPVSEYALGVILLSLKRFWSFSQAVKDGVDPWGDHNRVVAGAYRSTVGLVSCGMIARRIIQLLESLDIKCITYDPYVSDADAIAMGVELCSLEEVFRRSDVVSIHTPLLPDTKGLITGKLVGSMKEGATLINTSRGGLIRHDELQEVLTRRTDLTAILDVIDPEPPMPSMPLIRLPNVRVTPHIAGSLGPECRRLGRCMVDELERYLEGKPLHWQITAESAAKLA